MKMNKINISKDAREIARLLLSDEKFNGMLDDIISVNNKMVKKLGKDSFCPFLAIVLDEKEDGERHTIAIHPIDEMPQNKTEKNKMFRKIGEKVAKSGIPVIGVFFCAEVWMKRMDKEKVDLKKPVRDYDDKEEGVVVMGLTVDQRTNFATLYFDQKKGLKENDKIYFNEDTEEDVAVEGDLLNNFFLGYASTVVKGLDTSTDVERVDTDKLKVNSGKIEKITKKKIKELLSKNDNLAEA